MTRQSDTARRLAPRLAVLPLMLLFLPAAAPAQTAHDCGNGLTLRLSASSSVQGGLLRLEVVGPAPTADLKADWEGHTLPFWTDAARRNTSHALLGVNLDVPPGPHDLALKAQLTDGSQASCTVSIAVKDGKFPVEKLQVAQEFVEPNAAEIERADRERQRLREIYARVAPDRLWRGTFHMPLTGAHTARNFGRRRVLNGQPGSPHTGVDIPAPAGTPVHAAQRGRVVLADNFFFSGNTVVIDHGLGVYTFYGHLQSIAVKEGDTVERGALLGKVGATGRVTGPHLHWGLTVNDAHINPLQIVGVPLG